MKIQTIVCGPASVNTYLLVNESTMETIIIDPGEAAPVSEAIDTDLLIPKAILLTHGHFDHMIGCAELQQRYGIPVYIHEKDVCMIEEPNQYISPFYLPFSIDPVSEPVTVKDGDALEIAGISFRVLHTPGHTPGGVCYVVEPEKTVFCGDTLFRGSVGRTDFPYANSALMFAAIRKKVLPLPEDYIAMPGHGPATSIGREKSTNPYLNIIQ